MVEHFNFTNSTITSKDTSMISFYNNNARQNGGVGCISLYSKGIFEGNTTIKFDNNFAELNAGVLYSIQSKILFKRKFCFEINSQQSYIKWWSILILIIILMSSSLSSLT